MMKKKNKYFVINRRMNYFKSFLLFSFIFLLIYISSFIIFRKNYYKNLLTSMTNSVVDSKYAPRGRIFDRNYKLLVDNKLVPVIYYLNTNKDNSTNQIKEAYKLAKIIDIDVSKLSLKMLKDFYLVSNNCDSLISDKEWDKYYLDELSYNDIYKMKLERIDESIFNDYSVIDKKACYIYYLMNNGYYYEMKVIKKDRLTDDELVKFVDYIGNDSGFFIDYSYEREYLYGDTLKSIFGKVSLIPFDEKDYYLSNGYMISDMVGTSYLEKQYENYLKGTKGKYDYNTLEIIEYPKRGKDIVLTIDIDLQIKIEEILTRELMNAKNEPNTSLFNSAYVAIKDPSNGEILAMAGKKIRKVDGYYSVYDDAIGVLTNSMTPGSVVKGASMLVGFKENAINIGEVMSDNCVKIFSYPKKCSWKYLGNIDDIRALSLSSNVFQFKTALKVANVNYFYNVKVDDVENAFSKYRDFFNQIGLGSKSGIDLPIDGVGNIGKSNSPDLFLNYVIGQYDGYTTMQLSEYISTIANYGTRVYPHLLLEIRNNDNGDDVGSLFYKFSSKSIKLDIDNKYIDRIRLGFAEVMKSGLGKNFMGKVDNPSGKTGTSETVYDTNTLTVSNAFVGYYPSNNPKMSIALSFPNIMVVNDINGRSYANKRITKEISESFFELYH